MTDIKFITEPDETGLGRIVVDGKFYGLPSGAVAALARSFTAHKMADNAAKAFREGIASAIPEGWQLVPVEPTPEMVESAMPTSNLASRFQISESYRAMLAASPKQKETE